MQSKNTIRYLISQGVYPSFENRFWSKVRKTKSCWIWTGRIDSVGYGMISRGPRDGGYIRSHRASWIINRGPIPNGLHVLHNCPNKDNKLCVNPDHLYLGTDANNGADRALKHQCELGEERWNHKLNWKSVMEIRSSSMTQTALAKAHGVNQSVISKVISNKSWRLP